MTKPKTAKIVIFGFVGLGDMVQFSPCLNILRDGFRGSEITLVTIWHSVYDLFESSRHIDKVIYFDFFGSGFIERIKFVMSLRKRNFDISILPYPSYRREFNLFSAIVGAHRRYSFDFQKGSIRELVFLNNHLIKMGRDAHNLENNIGLMRAMGLHPPAEIKYDIPIKHSKEFVDNFLQTNSIRESDLVVGIHPGSDSRTKDKRLDTSKFAEISSHLASKYNAKIIVFLGPHEEDLKRYFAGLNNHLIVEKLDLNQIAQIISLCDLFISSDSGLMHIASAMGVPTVAIFGPTSHNSLRPWGVPYEIVRLGLPCSPCFSFERRPLTKPLIECKIDEKFACMKKIESGDVLAKVDKLISLLQPERQRI